MSQETGSGRFTDDLPQHIVAIVDGKWMTALMAILTIFVLWGDDLRLSAFRKEHDVYFYIIFSISLVMFLVEFFLNTIAKEDYKWSFFFWLDLIAGVSVAPDIIWIVDFVGSITSGATTSSSSSSVGSGVESAKTARVVRLVRLIRLIRIVKLYSMMRKASNADSEEKLRSQALAAQNAKQAALKRVEASRLGKVLSEMTTRRVVIMVLLMLFVNPLLQYSDTDASKRFGLSQIFWYGRSVCDAGASDHFGCDHQTDVHWMSEKGWQNLVYLYSNVHKDHQDRTAVAVDSLLWVYAPNRLNKGRLEGIASVDSDFGRWDQNDACSGFEVSDDCSFRSNELVFVSYQPFECLEHEFGCEEVLAFARFEDESRMINEAHYRMITTMFVCILLGSMSIQFQNDTQSLVIAPIEKMVNIIKQLAVDPLKMPDMTTLNETEVPKKDNGKAKKGPQLETTMLENTILKIGGLLQVGFGEAGAEIIGRNMSSGDGELNIMMPGTQITAIFGVVDIRQFSDCIECLQEDVLMFINTVGTILHQCVHRWNGRANKNLGGQFLVLWRLPDASQGGKSPSNDVAIKTNNLANNALLCFLKFLMECRRSERARSYATNASLITRFGDKFVMDFGMTLHAGWAIEGPIGSDFKVDARYLSPHVDLIINLEQATKIYKIPLLMSEKFYNMLSVRTKERIRKVDVIMFGHAAQGLYGHPVNDVIVEAPPGHRCAEIITLENLDVDASAMETEGAEYLFIVDEDMAQIQRGLSEEVSKLFREALVHYVGGDWEDAKGDLEKALELDPEDGPSLAIMSFISEYNFEAPADWPGWRHLQTLNLSL